MRNTIAVMNTKGGVGKSTMVLALAETLAAEHGKNVLVIDSDAQATASNMLMTVNDLCCLQREGLTIVDYLVARVLREEDAKWSDFVIRDVSDIDDARSVYLMPSDMQLTLFEREVSKEGAHGRLRTAIAEVLDAVRDVFDIILIDCPPGLSVLTESWLREADFHISPTKADYVSVCGLEVFRRFKSLNPEMGFAENMGVMINMRDQASKTDGEYIKWLKNNPANRCFEAVVPRVNSLQEAARFQSEHRSYGAKYPGAVGKAIKALSIEVLERMAAAPARAESPAAKTGTAKTVEPDTPKRAAS